MSQRFTRKFRNSIGRWRNTVLYLVVGSCAILKQLRLSKLLKISIQALMIMASWYWLSLCSQNLIKNKEGCIAIWNNRWLSVMGKHTTIGFNNQVLNVCSIRNMQFQENLIMKLWEHMYSRKKVSEVAISIEWSWWSWRGILNSLVISYHHIHKLNELY